MLKFCCFVVDAFVLNSEYFIVVVVGRRETDENERETRGRESGRETRG